jgi:SAM-dependent methyltransferase
MDIVDLREFYGSRLGSTTRRLLANRLKPANPPPPGATVLGLGYTTPYLAEIAPEARRTLAFMQARQGVAQWPEEGNIRCALVDECELPLLESSVDLAVVIHGLELTDAPGEMLKELWRVLAPQGRLLLVVPNRRGLWARFDTSPFGHGQPFSRPQLASLLRENQFEVMSWAPALFLPPASGALALSSAGMLESLGGFVAPAVSGVIVVEAVKQVYALSSGKRLRRFVPRLNPVLLPRPSTAGAHRSASAPGLGARISAGLAKR